MKYLFGPVISRRLGISLGIDLFASKTCSLDCIYCECGKTKILTNEIREYVPTDEVIAELQEFLKNSPKLDVITFAGSGEPTLHSGIGKIIKFLKKNFPEYKIVLLTNGTLLSLKKVRNSILEADIIIPSLDAGSENVFKKIARPATDITAKKLINGLIALRKEFIKKIILEVFITPGINDNTNELDLIKKACLKINPDLIQLNTLDRPGTEKWIRPALIEKLTEIKKYFKPLNTEIIQNHKVVKDGLSSKFSDTTDAIISSLSRRPSTIGDLTLSICIGNDEARKIIDTLLGNGTIVEEESVSRGKFYKVKKQD